MKILIVEDNADDRTLLRHIVERNGHVAVEARNGREGLAQAARHRPDLILSDALMPVMDGFLFLKKIKEDETLRSIPFIFYSAIYQADEDVELAKGLGASAYILKPKEPKELWAEVEGILERSCQAPTEPPKQVGEDQLRYLERYSEIVATKLEEKVAELEQALRLREDAEQKVKQQSEFLQRSLNALTHPFFVTNVKDYSIALANTASRVEGGREARTCYQLTHNRSEPCRGSEHPCTINEIKKTRAPVVLEHIHQGMAGEKKKVDVHGYPVFGDDGEIAQVIEYCIDVTERESLKDQLLQAQKMEAIGTLAGGIAHDFNNILSAVLGYTELAQSEAAEQKELLGYLEEIFRAGSRAKELVKQILTFSRKTDYEPKPLQLYLLVKEALKLLRATIPTTIEIRENIDPQGGAVLADPTQMHQVLMNLCTNAYQAMREKGGVLTVGLKKIDLAEEVGKGAGLPLSPGIYVRLTVSDTGPGIDPLFLDKIFEPYFTTKKKGEGTGLGLALVHGIIKSHNGHIAVHSELGTGTTFDVYLPCLVIEEPKESAQKQLQELPKGDERILVVDDEEGIVNLEEEMLKNLGYRATGMSSATKALAAFAAHPQDYDLIITDMSMPHMNGVELSNEILALRPDIPIILCTGFSELVDEESAKEIGIKAFVMKPISYRKLAAVVRQVLEVS